MSKIFYIFFKDIKRNINKDNCIFDIILFMIQEASAMGLLRTVLIIIGVYFAIKILARLFKPFILRFVVKKAEQQFGGFKNQQHPKQNHKAGETVIDKMPNRSTSSNKNVGEYVDYEEVD
ncbi:MAG: DUF4834 family protein [Winogradskyella sp.]